MSADAILALHDRIKALESQVEDLRHVLLCLCLQVQPPEGLGESLSQGIEDEDGNYGTPLFNLGRLLESQEHEISKLAQMLMQQTLAANGEERLPTVKDFREALEIVRSRQEKNRPRLPEADQGPQDSGK